MFLCVLVFPCLLLLFYVCLCFCVTWFLFDCCCCLFPCFSRLPRDKCSQRTGRSLRVSLCVLLSVGVPYCIVCNIFLCVYLCFCASWFFLVCCGFCCCCCCCCCFMSSCDSVCPCFCLVCCCCCFMSAFFLRVPVSSCLLLLLFACFSRLP